MSLNTEVASHRQSCHFTWTWECLSVSVSVKGMLYVFMCILGGLNIYILLKLHELND